MTTPNPIPDAEELRSTCNMIINSAVWGSAARDVARALLQRLDAESGAKRDERMFPVARGGQIPWRIAEIAYIEYAKRYGTQQSIDDLAKRGGFHADELDLFLPNWKELCAMPDGYQLALNVKHPDCHKAADAFWKYWNENGQTGNHGYYESTWGAINKAIRLVGVAPHKYGAAPSKTEDKP